MKEIKKDDILYAIYEPITDTTNKVNDFEFSIKEPSSTWVGSNNEALQIQRMCFDKGKAFKRHRHILRPRLNNYTQETFVIIQGKMKALIYDNNLEIIDTIDMTKGDILVCYRGAHSFVVMEDNTITVEVKNGPYTTREEDKEFI